MTIIDKIPKLAIKGVESSDEIVPYLSKRYRDIKFRYSYRHLSEQKEKIHSFIENDTFALVILDACRYDFFDQEIDEFLDGELTAVSTSVTATVSYVPAIFDDEYEDIAYITGTPTPTDHAFKRKELDYLPSEHFGKFVHVWKDCEKKELGAVPPEKMNEAVLQNLDDKLIVHYIQPHAPYIGEYRLRSDERKSLYDNLDEIYKKIGRYNQDDKEIPDIELRKAYRSNLRRVLCSVRELVSQLNRPIVVTSDHGEMLGENGRYIHGGPQHKHLCKLPWFEVDESMIGIKTREKNNPENIQNIKVTDQEVEKQLKNLGYL